MSLTPLPPTPRKVYTFALLSMNGLLPAELKFGEHTAMRSHNLDFGLNLDHELKVLSQR